MPGFPEFLKPLSDAFGNIDSQHEVVVVVCQFSEECWLPCNFNYNFITLILKQIDTSRAFQFWSIRVCNFIYKMILKIIVDSQILFP